MTGRFWEGRFIQELAGAVPAIAHVEFNPVRACMAETPEASYDNSIQERIGLLPVSSANITTTRAPSPRRRCRGSPLLSVGPARRRLET